VVIQADKDIRTTKTMMVVCAKSQSRKVATQLTKQTTEQLDDWIKYLP